MAEEHITEELLERLLASATPEAYLSTLGAGDDQQDTTLAAYLGQLLGEHGLSRAEAIRAAGVNATYGYQIFQGTRPHPSRDNAIMLAFGLGCTLREAQRLLRFAGVDELWCRRRRDAIVIFCLEHGLSRAACDDELWRLGEHTLAPED